MTVVRHAPGCPLLIAAIRARWPLTAAGLPDTPRLAPGQLRRASVGQVLGIDRDKPMLRFDARFGCRTRSAPVRQSKRNPVKRAARTL
jgi:hypothetical protein